MPDAVTAEVKSVLGHRLPGGSSPDDDYPDDFTTHFGFRVQVFIGEVGDDLADSFDVVVCSPTWFAEQIASGRWDLFQGPVYNAMPESVAVGAGCWFMREWERSALEEGLSVLCAQASPGPNWGTVAARIGEQLPWEYAYRHHAQVNSQHGLPGPGS